MLLQQLRRWRVGPWKGLETSQEKWRLLMHQQWQAHYARQLYLGMIGYEHGSSYLKELVPDFVLSSLSLSFFSFCAGGVLTRLEAPESCALDRLSGFRVLDPLALANIDVGPNVCPAVLVCRTFCLLPSLLRSSIPTVGLAKS